MSLYIKNNYIDKEVIIRGKKYLAVSLPIRYMLYVGITCTFCLSVIYFLLNFIFGAIELMLAALFLLLIYHYVLNRNTKITITQLNHYFVHGSTYDLRLNEDYMELIVNQKVVQRFNYEIFKQIVKTDKEYILISKSRSFIAIQEKNMNSQEKEIFIKMICHRRIKKLTKLN